MRRIILPLTLSFLAMAAMTPFANAASFDCERSDLAPDEKVICENRDLNDADVKMVTTFDLLSGLFAMGNRGNMQDDQVQWLKQRQACGSDAACIREAYKARLTQLQTMYDDLPRPL